MTKPHVYKFDLERIQEPEDLWNRLFFAWLKNLSEQNAMNRNWLSAHTHAITQFESAVAKLLPEQPDELRNAMKALQDLQDVWEQQSARSVENVEKMAVVAKQIIASQSTE